METSPKTRSPRGTYVVVEDRFGCCIKTLQEWLEVGGFRYSRIHVVSLTKGPLKSWLRAWEHRREMERRKSMAED